MKRYLRTSLWMALLTLILVIGVLAVPASAAEVASSTCGENLTWVLDDTGTLTISGTGAMDSNPGTDVFWYGHRSSIYQVLIEEGVTTIGSAAFSGCSSLTNITIPDSVTSIPNSAFYRCSSLETVTIPDSVTSIDHGAFWSCSNLQSITIPDSVTTIGSDAFSCCSSLRSITIPDSVTSIPYRAFYSCSSLTSITIPDSVTSIESSAFSDCRSLESITIPDSVTSIGQSAFSGCSSLTSITISDSVTSIGNYAFSGCSSLTSITIPDSVTSIGQSAFSGCSSLESITLPNSLIRINDYAFQDCVSLASITIPKNVTYIGRVVFTGCISLTGIWVAEDNTAFCCDEFGVLFNKDMSELVACSGGLSGVYTVPRSVTRIGEHAFRGCDDLTSIILPDSIASIGGCAFSSCYKLKSITLPKGITEISESAFEYSSSLKSITIPEGVTFIGKRAFFHCVGLTEIILPESLKSIGENAFSECSKLEDTYYSGTEIQWHKIGKNRPTGRVHYNYQYPVFSVTRLAGENRLVTSELIANQLKEKMGVEKFENIIVASGGTFADALPGSYLAAVKNAPILLTLAKQKYIDQTAAYIKDNLVEGGTVYILGGESAVPTLMETALTGINVKRVAGADRFGTNLAILKEAGVKEGDEILVCTAKEFADSLSAAATGKPILLVYKKITDEEKAYLATLSGNTFCVVGGTSAVPENLEEAMKAYGEVSRLAGKDRLDTSILVAKKYFPDATTSVVAYGWDFPDGLCGGSLAYATKSPLILAHSKEKLFQFTSDYTVEAGLKAGFVLGGDKLVTDDATRAIFGMGSAPITLIQ